MDVTPKEAFRLGFLARCAEERLTGPALDARLEKVAEFNKNALSIPGVDIKNLTLGGGSLGSAISNPASLLWNGMTTAWAIPPAASILGGAGLGYGVAKMVEPRVSDDEIKAQELAATYKLYAEKARARRKLRNYRLGHSES